VATDFAGSPAVGAAAEGTGLTTAGAACGGGGGGGAGLIAVVDGAVDCDGGNAGLTAALDGTLREGPPDPEPPDPFGSVGAGVPQLASPEATFLASARSLDVVAAGPLGAPELGRDTTVGSDTFMVGRPPGAVVATAFELWPAAGTEV
jgi:hypothetical protein